MSFNLNFLKTAKVDAGKALGFLGNAVASAVPGVNAVNQTSGQAQQIKQQVAALPAPVRSQITASPQYAKIQQTPTTPAAQITNLGIGATRGIARVPETVARSYIQSKAPTGANFDQPTQNTGIKEAIYGKEPIQTYQTRYQGNQQVLKKAGVGAASTPLAFLGSVFTAGTDVSGFGGVEKALGKEGIEQIAKAATQNEVKKIIGTKIAPHVVGRIAPALAQTKDPNVIRNIIKGSSDIPARPNISIPAVDRKAVSTAPIGKEVKSPPAPHPNETITAYSGGGTGYSTANKDFANSFVDETNNGRVYQRSIKQSDVLDTRNPDQRAQLESVLGKDKVTQMIDRSNNGLPNHAQRGEQDSLIQAAKDLGYKHVALSETDKQTKFMGKDIISYADTGARKLSGAAEQAHLAKGADQRGFLASLQNDKTATPELKQALGEVKPQTHDIRATQPLVDKAKNIAPEQVESESKRILTTDNPTSQDVVSGYELIGRASKTGKINDAVDLAVHLDNKLRESGRTVQAASVVNNLSPEGVLKFAARKLRQAREGKSTLTFEGGAGNEGNVANKIKKAVDDSSMLKKKDITNAVRDTASGKKVEDLTTGQKVAKKVETAVTPQVKKKADTLVDELTKKIKQEQLTPLPKAAKKSPTDILREVFGRNKEAQDAYPEAQRILQEKFANNPKALGTLDKFFNSELGLPAASSTINGAIKEQLVKNESKISDIIHTSWNSQKQSVDDVAKALTKEGFDEQSAKTIAKEVTDRLNSQVGVAKKTALEKLAKDAPKGAQATYLDKVNKFSNLGALDDKDYLDLARGKLKLPNLTPDLAKDISGLAQKMQDLPQGEERDALAKQIYGKINEAIPKSKSQLAGEVLAAPKAVMASYDLSGTLRQGGVLGSRFPKEAKDAFAKQAHYFASGKTFDKGMSAIRHDPLFEVANKAKIALTGTGGAEEAFASTLPEKIPLFGKGIEASDRAYTGALTELRFNSFKHIANDLKSAGIDIGTFNDKKLESIGKYINTASGRGSGKAGGLFEKAAPALNATLFSPRLWKSRLDMLNPVYYAKLDPVARKYALQNAGSFAAIAGTVLGLATLAGGSVETDARSSDFLKVKFGDTRYDILGGFQQNLVFAWREITGQKKSSLTGAVSDLNSGGFGSPNRLSILSDLIQNKENPVIATAGTVIKGVDKAGNKLSGLGKLKEVGKLAIPLNFQDTLSTIKNTGSIPKGLLKATVPGSLGVGVGTYGKKDIQPSQIQQAALKKLQASGASKDDIKNYTDAFQTIKVGPPRTNASDAIDKALAKGDTAKAQQIAKDYNDKAFKNIKPWLEANKGKQVPKVVYDALGSAFINLDESSITSRQQSIAANPDKYNLKPR